VPQFNFLKFFELKVVPQQPLFPYNDPGQLPITPLREPNGEWLRLENKLPGYSVWLGAWQVQAGRLKLYLRYSNDAANFPAHRGIPMALLEVRQIGVIHAVS
jgi:starch phosphorylase